MIPERIVHSPFSVEPAQKNWQPWKSFAVLTICDIVLEMLPVTITEQHCLAATRVAGLGVPAIRVG